MPDTTPASLELIIRQGLDSSPDCFGILNHLGKVIYCNNTFAAAYGITKEEAYGKTNKELLKLAWENQQGILIETDDFDAWYENVEKLQKERKLNSFETDFTDGRWFKMTRTNLDNGYILLFGVDITGLKDTQNSLEKANLRIEALANTDQLTGIGNRRSFMTKSNYEIKRAKRYKQPLSLLILDLDYFKQINDNYGHDGGDFVLRHFACLCAELLRQTDSLFRIGGEEFAILLPMTNIDAAQHIAERIRSHISAHSFYFKDMNQYIDVSVSIGVGYLTDTEHSVKAILTQADNALYQAKRKGRNQVVTCCA
ncbi:diguanylate cyclase [Vibrio sp. JC009]|uniref:sensor domain-containing diguanylate cyclase n=1 Tax=Vibrio sp. JC009 TaxID=2912314 RepID=UPI0023AF11D5|nr:diguanylate cyclase [Vibrio sp. JC009]WED24719.1 diguanylate cyclase [Vibrio sp. JC009]